MEDKRSYSKVMTYRDSVYFYGNIWNLSITAILLFAPILCCFIYQVWPDWALLGAGLIATAPMYIAVGVVEVFTYIPMLGTGGTYLSFVTGNISNLKLPCALNALEQSGYEASSEEGDVIPALFGGLGVVFVSKNWKIAIAPVVLMLILFIAIPGLGGSVGIMVPVSAIFTIISARILYKKCFLG